jgi:hypothetical protein
VTNAQKYSMKYAKLMILLSLLTIFFGAAFVKTWEYAYRQGEDKMATEWLQGCAAGVSIKLKDIIIYCGPVVET